MKRTGLQPDARDRSRELRRDASPVERKLWHSLRKSFPEAHFRRQVPMGSYFADFACHAHKIVIELDGDSHAHSQSYDAARTRFIEGEGYLVIRFGNNDVMTNLDGVLTELSMRLVTPTPNPSPQGGGERFVSTTNPTLFGGGEFSFHHQSNRPPCGEGGAASAASGGGVK